MMTLQLLPCLLVMTAPSPTRLHYSCEVITSNTLGKVTRRLMIDGNIDSGPREERWSKVSLADDAGPKPQSFMEGLHYDSSIKGVLQTPGAVKQIPELSTEARDMVDDMIMFREFAAYSGRLKPGIETRFGTGSKTAKGLNVNTMLSSLGEAAVDGHRCQVMKYENFFSDMDLKFPGVHLLGRSHTWGEIWVDKHSHTLVRARMREDLLGELTMGEAKTSTPINVFRKGTLKLR